MEENNRSDLESIFAQVEDPRMERTRRHRLRDIIILAICGTLCGAEGWVEIEEFGRAKEAFAINSVQLWSDRKAAIRELYRVLRPDGMLALTLQPHNAKTDQDFKAIGEQLLFDLTQIGFFNTKLQIKEHTPTNILCALGRK
ncbi:hypothetical protein KSD_09570 [Ktedonobacter sp. SOSP1-85]|uniref:transposase family protein n=1 Tax=Ktedonobacter sp. SOSP1-85 TaxID=2778367 RepID=UPI001A18D3AD|nr:transposase family protein [Ktedonobacter sp. SOSP1-85]GHO73186.1 hypothetical protein KSD_09570 [Ktedonobacter sp. SOSP1-85]